jgi:hypothetical protein
MIVEARTLALSEHMPTNTSSLRFATLLIELRQEVHIAFMTNRAPPAKLVKYCAIDRSLEPVDDWMWTYRMTAHIAEILTYCNGSGPKTLQQWSELWAYLDDWEGLVPLSFRPIFEDAAESADGRMLPDIWFANDCHGESSTRIPWMNGCG